jgi:4-hydroxy-2-oxoglutarate aldolase
MSPPPAGVYVPAVLFLDQNEELDEESIQKHVLRLAKVVATRAIIIKLIGSQSLTSYREVSLAFWCRAAMVKHSCCYTMREREQFV